MRERFWYWMLYGVLIACVVIFVVFAWSLVSNHMGWRQ